MATKKSKASTGKSRHDGNIVIAYTVTTADGKKHDSGELSISNPRGCMPASKVCDADYITASLKEVLQNRFGANHVR